MDIRQSETELIEKCVWLATGKQHHATNSKEANIFLVASSLVKSLHPQASGLLGVASSSYFEVYPDQKMDVQHILKQKWIVSLPRLKSRLCARLSQAKFKEKGE